MGLTTQSDIRERDSNLCSVIYDKGSDFSITKSPFGLENQLEDGALAEGGAPNLYSKDYFGLIINYCAVGVVYGGFPGTVYPFLKIYLNMESYQTAAASILISMPWSFKTFIGLISDSFPIFGFRRRSYMVLGWAICSIFLVIMGVMPIDEPYYRYDSNGHKIKPPNNPSAPDSGFKYIILMFLSAMGYIIADVAADGMVVDLARREPIATRGVTQTTIYLYRTLFTTFSVALLAFGMNGHEYGGNFSFQLPFGAFMLIFSIFSIAAIPASILLIKESKSERESFLVKLHDLWYMIQKRSIWQIMAYKFFSSLFAGFGSVAATAVQELWAKAEPFNDKMIQLVGTLFMALALKVAKGKWGLQADWRVVIVTVTLAVVVIDSFSTMLTIFNVIRNQWFWLGIPLLEEFPAGIKFIISTYCIVEVAEPGFEGTTYGLISTVANLANPFASVFYKYIDSFFDVTDKAIEMDTADVRMAVAYTFIISYVMKILSCAWVVILPRQKKECQELRAKGGSSKIVGAIAAFLSIFALVFSLTSSLLTIFPSTKCLRIAGGKGCH